MTQANTPISEAGAIEIGRAIEALAEKIREAEAITDDTQRQQSIESAQQTAEETIVGNMQRPGGPAVDKVNFVEDPDDTTKTVIVPAIEILDSMRPGVGASQSEYKLMDSYIAIAALLLEKAHEELNPGSTLGEFVKERALQAKEPLDFFYLRLGEYSVTQCE